MREFITGNQAIVRGALRAGCDFFAAYPITPAGPIYTEIKRAFGRVGGTAIQTEDQIAAIGQCIGAAMAGARAMTASSGPGLSLCSDNIGLAQMGEVPLVIVDCQRMGPATASATAAGEGDVLFARHVTSGGYPLPVLAAADAATAYRLTYEAFNIAERLRTPVIVLASKDISLSRQTVDLEAIELPPQARRPLAPRDQAFLPYAVQAPEDVPAFAPLGGARRVRFTGLVHDEAGMLTIDRAKIRRKLTHLREKIVAHQEQLEIVESDLDTRAETLIVSYGLADGAAREAVAAIRESGGYMSHLTIYSLWPVPERALRQALTPQVTCVVVPELNVGLYADELRKLVTTARVESIQRFDGGLIHPQTLAHRVLECERDWPIVRERSSAAGNEDPVLRRASAGHKKEDRRSQRSRVRARKGGGCRS